ncbi:hypothetical protein HK102_002456 [Quaeritorhiza haematococci]|nr:hypothetical protein HK102_002456 [Quaeritorhiza haematococci]
MSEHFTGIRTTSQERSALRFTKMDSNRHAAVDVFDQYGRRLSTRRSSGTSEKVGSEASPEVRPTSSSSAIGTSYETPFEPTSAIGTPYLNPAEPNTSIGTPYVTPSRPAAATVMSGLGSDIERERIEREGGPVGDSYVAPAVEAAPVREEAKPSKMHGIYEKVVGSVQSGLGKMTGSERMEVKGLQKKIVGEQEVEAVKALQKESKSATAAHMATEGQGNFGPSAVAGQGGRLCGTREARDEDFAQGRRLAEVSVASLRVDFPVDIDVHFHVINNGEGIDNGDLPQNMIEDQIRVLNEDFKGTGLFNFRLAAVDRTTNATWFTMGYESTEEREMKRTLRKGGPTDLNVYSADIALLGWATFPSWYAGDPQDDGVVIAHASVPGGSRERFNLGKTLTHEVGHWLGLFHTFTGGCSYPNDGITDTVPQKNSTEGCPIGQKTCTRDDFPRDQQHIFERADLNVTQDPIHNFMDYSDDACMNEFTPGQAEKMRSEWVLFRAGGKA